MDRNLLADMGISIAFVALAFVLVDPLHWWMPSMLQYISLAGLVALFAVLVVLVVRERARDEREEQLRSRAGRTAFLFGAGVLVIAVVWQSQMTRIDPWLLYALIAMMAGKFGTRVIAG